MTKLIKLPLSILFLAGLGLSAGAASSDGVFAEASPDPQAPGGKLPPTLVEARRGFKTKPTSTEKAPEPVPKPPAKLFRVVHYNSNVGKLAAYVSPDPKDGKKHPAIVWITGGDCNSIGEVWEPSPKDNEQSASAYRKAGIVMMFPSLRGGNENPGKHEGFFGEVDDVLAATEYLAKLPYVDSSHIYLGGHSTGGTLVMLTAEMSDRFRAVFAFGPAADVRGYGPEFATFDVSDEKEASLRSPAYWLDSVRAPLYVLEGTEPTGNIESLRGMAKLSKNPNVHFLEVKGGNHFSILGRTNEIIAKKILRDEGKDSNLSLTEAELSGGRR